MVLPRGDRPQILILFSDLSASFQSLRSSSYADNYIRLSFSFVMEDSVPDVEDLCAELMVEVELLTERVKAEGRGEVGGDRLGAARWNGEAGQGM